MTEDNITLNLYNFFLISCFMNRGILQFRINHHPWLFGTSPFTSLGVVLQMAKVLHEIV